MCANNKTPGIKEAYSEASILFRSESAVCPNKVFDPKTEHKTLKKDGKKELINQEIMDLMSLSAGREQYPVKIKARVQQWYCTTCNTIFIDPIYPYEKNLKATTEYKKYVIHIFLQSVDCDMKRYSESYNVTVDALERERRNMQKVLYQERRSKNNPMCDDIWLVSFPYGKKDVRRVVGIGKTTNGDFVLFGFCNASFKAAEKEFDLHSQRGSVKKLYISMYCDDKMFMAAQTAGYPVDDLESITFPSEITDILNIIEDLESNQVSRDQMEFRLLYHNRYQIGQKTNRQSQSMFEISRISFLADMSNAYMNKIYTSAAKGFDEKGVYDVTDLHELITSFRKPIDLTNTKRGFHKSILIKQLSDLISKDIGLEPLKTKGRGAHITRSVTGDIFACNANPISIEEQFRDTFRLNKEQDCSDFVIEAEAGQLKIGALE